LLGVVLGLRGHGLLGRLRSWLGRLRGSLGRVLRDGPGLGIETDAGELVELGHGGILAGMTTERPADISDLRYVVQCALAYASCCPLLDPLDTMDSNEQLQRQRFAQLVESLRSLPLEVLTQLDLSLKCVLPSRSHAAISDSRENQNGSKMVPS